MRTKLVLSSFVVAALIAPAAWASNHAAPPPDPRDLGAVLAWEWQHFMIHMDMTFRSIVASVQGDQGLATLLMAGQVGCSNLSFATTFLFGSAGMALATFAFVTLVLPGGLMYLGWRMRARLMAAIANMRAVLAPRRAAFA